MRVQAFAAHRGGSTNVAGYQDAIDHRVMTNHPGGCAPARGDHSVDAVFQHPNVDALSASANRRLK
jgi:hypothetical protein